MSDISKNLPDSAQGTPLESAAPALREASAPAAAAGSGTAPALTVRIWCAFALSLCLGMLGVGYLLTPSPNGSGTHRQLGLPPCGFYESTGIPCPTCGCTTAVSHFSHGQVLASFLTQPFGFYVAVVALAIVPLAGYGLATGKWRGPSMFTLGWYWRYWLYGSLAILLFGWIFKIISVKTGHG